MAKTWHVNSTADDGTPVSLYVVDGQNARKLGWLQKGDDGLWPLNIQPAEDAPHFRVRMAFANELTALTMIDELRVVAAFERVAGKVVDTAYGRARVV